MQFAARRRRRANADLLMALVGVCGPWSRFSGWPVLVMSKRLSFVQTFQKLDLLGDIFLPSRQGRPSIGAGHFILGRVR
jgi:hypothetical protein